MGAGWTGTPPAGGLKPADGRKEGSLWSSFWFLPGDWHLSQIPTEVMLNRCFGELRVGFVHALGDLGRATAVGEALEFCGGGTGRAAQAGGVRRHVSTGRFRNPGQSWGTSQGFLPGLRWSWRHTWRSGCTHVGRAQLSLKTHLHHAFL